ncbi:ferredoxin family protein [Propioniciclava coleopterorum]|uniref:Ferredoxin family protein n=1 Tax=Propioniciclava coleopterorum TaxID=2714937 RepID=A0A6G7Y768_9ACTN|nr:ferredoxin family protein [Propioniciclava coleopterorum]QIK72633.1 ferredoxin family protein [Propioniciclava coleopterorum]
MTAEPDLTRPMLRWLTSIDLPARVLVVCAHGGAGFVPATEALVRLDGCVADAGIGLPAQLLACGVARVGVLPCVEDPARGAAQVASWAEVLPDVAAADPVPTPRRRIRRPASGPVYELGRPQVSRRFAFGLGAAHGLPFALADEEPQRVVASLRLLEEQGRARFARPATPAAAVPVDPSASGEVLAATAADRQLTGEDRIETVDPLPPVDDHPATPADQPCAAVDQPGSHPDAPGATGRRAEPGSSAVALAASGCVACGVCVRACPHDALDLAHEADRSVLTQIPERCSGEQACVRLCPHDALSVAGAFSLFDLARTPTAELAVVATAGCKRCGARHPAAEGELCPPCAFRSRNAFGHMPVQPR